MFSEIGRLGPHTEFFNTIRTNLPFASDVRQRVLTIKHGRVTRIQGSVMLGRKCGEDEVALKLTVLLPIHQKFPAINPERNGGVCKTENNAHGKSLPIAWRLRAKVKSLNFETIGEG